MAEPAGDENEERYEQLRRRVRELQARVLELDAAVPDVGAGEGASPSPSPETARLDVEVEAGEPFPIEPDERLVQAVHELTGTTDALVALGDRLPVLRDVPARAWSVQIVRASALAMLLGSVLLGLGIWRGILAVWWLPVLLVMLPAGVRAALLRIAPAAGRHRRQRYAGAAAGAAALLVAPAAAVFGWLPGLLVAAAFGVAAGALFEVRWGRP